MRGITRRIALALGMSLALLLIGLPVIQLVLTWVSPAPLTYANVPFPVCSSASTTICIPLADGESFHPSDVVPLHATRCIDKFWSGVDGEKPLAYNVNRQVANAVTGTRIILPDFSSSAEAGCTTVISLANQLPPVIAPGTYYLEGVATVYGRFRTNNVYWRSAVFTVSKPSD